MAFKPYCQTCNSWHNDNEPHIGVNEMNNEVMTYHTPELLSKDDGWEDAADEANERILRGTLLKFSDWRWTAGQEGRLIPEGTKMAAMGTAAAWVRWEGGKPAQYVVRK